MPAAFCCHMLTCTICTGRKLKILMLWPTYKEDFLTDIREEVSVRVGVIWIFVASIGDNDGDEDTNTHKYCLVCVCNLTCRIVKTY